MEGLDGEGWVPLAFFATASIALVIEQGKGVAIFSTFLPPLMWHIFMMGQ